MTRLLANALGYQAVWFIAVLSAAAGMWWPGVAAALVFVAVQPPSPRGARAGVQLAAAALLAGLVLDGALAASGLLHYAAAVAWCPAPPWILAVWIAFAATLERSLRFLQRRPFIAALLGGIGGPLAYLAAERLGAVAFAAPRDVALGLLALGWVIVLPALAALSARGSRLSAGALASRSTR